MNARKTLITICVACVALFVVFKAKDMSTPMATRLTSVDDNTRNMALARMMKLDPNERAKIAVDILKLPPNPDPRGRRFTIYALRKLGSFTPETIAFYGRLLTDLDPAVRAEATNALMESGDASLPVLFTILQGPDGAARAEAARITVRVGEPAVGGLIHLLDNPVSAVTAAWILKKIGPSAQDAVPALNHAIKTGSPNLKVEAALALCAIKSPAAEAVPVLADALPKSSWDTRGLEIVQALEKMGTVSKPAVPELTSRMLKSKDSFVDKNAPRPAIARALQKIDPRRMGVSELGFDLKQRKADIRYRAAFALSEQNPPSPGAMQMLVNALDDSDIYVSARSLVALTRIGLEKTERIKKIADPKIKSALKRGREAGIEGFVEIVEPALANLNKE